MSEKRLLLIIKYFLLLSFTFILVGPPVIKRYGNLNINGYFFHLKSKFYPSNFEAESLYKTKRFQNNVKTVPSIDAILALIEYTYGDKKVYKKDILTSEVNKNGEKQKGTIVLDKKKDLPKIPEDQSLLQPFNLRITGDSEEKNEKPSETKDKKKLGASMQGVSIH